MPRSIALTCGLALTAAAIAVPAAQASTAQVVGTKLVYTAAAGETNALIASIVTATGKYRLRDPGATITPGPGCVAATVNDVRCDQAGVTSLEVALGDGADTAKIGLATPAV